VLKIHITLYAFRSDPDQVLTLARDVPTYLVTLYSLREVGYEGDFSKVA
jgi:hypothetical protein